MKQKVYVCIIMLLCFNVAVYGDCTPSENASGETDTGCPNLVKTVTWYLIWQTNMKRLGQILVDRDIVQIQRYVVLRIR